MPRIHKDSNKGNQPFEKVAKALDLPRTVIPGSSNIELFDNREAVIDGCKGIVEYNEDVIKLSLGKLNVCFQGADLLIKSMTVDQVIIEGQIISIQFLT